MLQCLLLLLLQLLLSLLLLLLLLFLLLVFLVRMPCGRIAGTPSCRGPLHSDIDARQDIIRANHAAIIPSASMCLLLFRLCPSACRRWLELDRDTTRLQGICPTRL